VRAAAQNRAPGAAAARAGGKRRRWADVARRAVLLVLATAGCVIFFIPFAWMVSTAGKEGSLVWKVPPVWLPPHYEWRNYLDSWRMLPFALFYRNTLTITLLNGLGVVLSSSLAAFAFSRLRFRGRGFLFVLVLSTLMIPWHVTVIPQYMLFARLGWVNTLYPLWVRGWLGDAFSIFLLRQFFMTVSHEMDDAARMDGCSNFEVFWRILVPLSRSALTVVAIFEFTWSWNNFMGPLIYLDSVKLFPVALGLRLFQQRNETHLQLMMAQTVVSVLPVLGLFFLTQKYFIQGIVVTGVKG
jgi:multiple sugar transport system permease protein